MQTWAVASITACSSLLCSAPCEETTSCLLGPPGPWEAHKLGFQWSPIFSTQSFSLHHLFPFLSSCFLQDRPQEKPICIFISNLDQLRAAAPPISPLLWEFMENVYPGGIGCIIKKGEWLKKLGEMNRTILLSLFCAFNTARLQSTHPFGHQWGDILLILSWEIISAALTSLGKCLAEGVNEL